MPHLRKNAWKLLGGASLAMAALGMAGGTAVASNGSGSPSPTVCAAVNAGYNGCFTQNTVVNKNWTIVNSTLSVTGSYGWVSTFTFTQKTPMRGGLTASSTGTVTDITEYGTSTESFTAVAGSAAPFGVVTGTSYTLISGLTVPQGDIWADNGSFYYLPSTGYSGYSM